MFTGTYNHQIDGKGRLRLPAKLRQELGSSFYLMPGIDNTITILPQSAVDAMNEEFASYDQTDIEILRITSEIFGSMQAIVEDSQGRFVIPGDFLEEAKIEKNVVIRGARDKIQIWADKSHESRESKMSVNEMMAMLNKARKNG